MNTKLLGSLQLLAAVVLAASFAMPIAESTSFVKADGTPVRSMRLSEPSQSWTAVTSYEYVWQDLHPVVPLIFFAPLVLVALARFVRSRRAGVAFDVLVPFVGLGLLAMLIAIVYLADLEVLPFFWPAIERAYGGYVALTALGCFCLAGLMRAVEVIRGRLPLGLFGSSSSASA